MLTLAALVPCLLNVVSTIGCCRQDAAEEYSELIGKHKRQNEKMLKGAKPADLYRENAKATSAANAKPGGDDLLDKQTHDR